jgi:hypothetical protein
VPCNTWFELGPGRSENTTDYLLPVHLSLSWLHVCISANHLQGALDVSQLKRSGVVTQTYKASADAIRLSAPVLISLFLLSESLPPPTVLSMLLAYEVDSQLIRLQQPVTLKLHNYMYTASGVKGRPLLLPSRDSVYTCTSMLPKSGVGPGVLVVKVATQQQQSVMGPHQGQEDNQGSFQAGAGKHTAPGGSKQADAVDEQPPKRARVGRGLSAIRPVPPAKQRPAVLCQDARADLEQVRSAEQEQPVKCTRLDTGPSAVGHVPPVARHPAVLTEAGTGQAELEVQDAPAPGTRDNSRGSSTMRRSKREPWMVWHLTLQQGCSHLQGRLPHLQDKSLAEPTHICTAAQGSRAG